MKSMEGNLIYVNVRVSPNLGMILKQFDIPEGEFVVIGTYPKGKSPTDPDYKLGIICASIERLDGKGEIIKMMSGGNERNNKIIDYLINESKKDKDINSRVEELRRVSLADGYVSDTAKSFVIDEDNS